MKHGSPQGGILSPTLFSMLMNDIQTILPTGVYGAMYSDDMAIWATEKYTGTTQSLHHHHYTVSTSPWLQSQYITMATLAVHHHGYRVSTSPWLQSQYITMATLAVHHHGYTGSSSPSLHTFWLSST
ncbi:hypothetical protein ElyMa_005412600 [Elysia marginata]|uniref:Reverse transcriptase domain-containing protein n=1 Tax=Elysia marginata TaxID=1093978 RepID=A0AAV4EI43_9GAST|nr:hypothetical protein ElyMa_005412600 [Elysia marginata]